MVRVVQVHLKQALLQGGPASTLLPRRTYLRVGPRSYHYGVHHEAEGRGLEGEGRVRR